MSDSGPESKEYEPEAVLTEDQQGQLQAKYQKVETAKLAGNALLQSSDFEAAVKEYEKGAHELQHHLCQAKATKDRTDQLSVAIHLNIALAHMKRDEACGGSREILGKARLNLHMALTMDPENVKGLYRRGMVQVKLARRHELFDDTEAKAALDDFERALRLDPTNADVQKELTKLRHEIRNQAADLKTQSKKNWAGVFHSKNAEERPELKKAAKEPPKRPVRGDGRGDSRRHVATLEGAPRAAKHLPKRLEGLVAEDPEADKPVEPVQIENHEGWCFGICGAKDSGASAFGRVFANKLEPSAVGSSKLVLNPRQTAPIVSMPVLGAIVVATIACTYGAASLGAQTEHAIGVALPVVVFLIGAMCTGMGATMLWQDQQEQLDESIQVLYLTSDSADREPISTSSTVAELIGDPLEKCPVVRRRHTKEEAQTKVVAMLSAAGFQYEGKGPDKCLKERITWGQLSAEQRHLIYCVRCLAKSPDLLVCDEPLEGLDEMAQVRFLRMMRYMKREIGLSIVYVSADPYQLQLIADGVAFVGSGAIKGQIAESGPMGEVLEFPRHFATETYVERLRGNRVIAEEGQALVDRFAGLVNDPEIEGKWFPKKAKKRPRRVRPPRR